MIVAIRAEMDSRVILYPLIRALNVYGKVCVISSNRQLSRLIEDEDSGGFRNIRVIVDEFGALDTVYTDYGIVNSDFDYIILDNMGAIEYDVLIVPVGEVVSDSFQNDVNLLKTDVSVRFIQFGVSNKSKKKFVTVSKHKQEKVDLEEVDIEDDPAEKFKLHKNIDEEYNVAERFYACNYITYEEIEDMESRYILPAINNDLAEAIYDIFKDRFAIDKKTYMKEIKRPDEELTGNVRSVIADIESDPHKRRR